MASISENTHARTPGIKFPISLRESFDEDGFCVAPGLIDAAMVAKGRVAIERLITPETPAGVVYIWGTRRQAATPAVFLPELDEFAWQPRVLDAVSKMIDGPFRLNCPPIATVTFPGRVCGDIQTDNWTGHLDGIPTESFEKIGHLRCSLWLAFADIESMGGAMVVIRGSHKIIHHRAATDPAWVEYRSRHNQFTRHDNIEGVPWRPVEITCKAGDGFFYYGHSIHSGSDNHSLHPRVVAVFNYVNREAFPPTEETLAKEFSRKHLDSMSPPMRQTVGL